MTFEERAVDFACAELWMHGIASVPSSVLSSRGVLIVVGGPQYRVGSHRQFVLLARDLAASGIPAFRFDYRGMGDSEGDIKSFDDIDDDLHDAVDAFTRAVPSIREIVVWGLCDAASAAVFYAQRDERVTGLVLLNPWVRTAQGAAKTYLKKYYLQRLFTAGFWQKVRSGRLDYVEVWKSLLSTAKHAFLTSKAAISSAEAADENARQPDLPKRLYEGLAAFQGQILIILSAGDFTAQEFQQLANSSRRWRKLFASGKIQTRILAGANHTFARREWRDRVSLWTRVWLAIW